MANKMTLREHRKSLGLSQGQLAKLAGIDRKVIVEAEYVSGMPISKAKALLLCEALSKEHNRPILLGDIADLKTC